MAATAHQLQLVLLAVTQQKSKPGQMGISGLLPNLKSIAVSRHISAYAGKRIAVDSFCWLHRAALSCAKDLCEKRLNPRFVEYCMRQVELLRHHGVIPVLIFDGAGLPMKREENDKRRRGRKENLARAIAHEKAGNRTAAHECYLKAVDISSTAAHYLITVLQEHSVEFIVAPYEADAQMAYLAYSGYVHAVLTEDSDLIAYACPRILYKMDNMGNGSEIEFANLPRCTQLNFVDFTRQMVLEMCILSGCDYVPSLPGIGVKKAHALIRRFKHYQKVLKHLRMDGVHISEGYHERFQLAIWTFHHQRVYCPERKSLVHLTALKTTDDLPESLDFLGPDLEPEVAVAVATGRVCPSSKEEFEELDMAPSTADNGNNQPSSRRSQPPFNLAVQKNTLLKYLKANSTLEAKAQFKRPRSSPPDIASPTAASPADTPASIAQHTQHEAPSLSAYAYGTDSEPSTSSSMYAEVMRPFRKPKRMLPSPLSAVDASPDEELSAPAPKPSLRGREDSSPEQATVSERKRVASPLNDNDDDAISCDKLLVPKPSARDKEHRKEASRPAQQAALAGRKTSSYFAKKSVRVELELPAELPAATTSFDPSEVVPESDPEESEVAHRREEPEGSDTMAESEMESKASGDSRRKRHRQEAQGADSAGPRGKPLYDSPLLGEALHCRSFVTKVDHVSRYSAIAKGVLDRLGWDQYRCMSTTSGGKSSSPTAARSSAAAAASASCSFDDFVYSPKSQL